MVDVANKPWFRLETREDQARKKRLILNTGIQHGFVEQKGSTWHIYVAKERRVTICRENALSRNKPAYLIYLHRAPYPEQSAGNEYGLLEPALAIYGDPASFDFSFQDCSAIGDRSAATVRRVLRKQGEEQIEVHVSANVDAALIVIAAIAISAQESEVQILFSPPS